MHNFIWGSYVHILRNVIGAICCAFSTINTMLMQLFRLCHKYNNLLGRCISRNYAQKLITGSKLCMVLAVMHRSQWSRGLRHEMSSPAWTLGSWVRIPLEAWMFVCVYSVFLLSCVVAALRRADHWSKESYQLSISVRLRNLIERRPRPDMGCSAIGRRTSSNALL
jgi:hypothetical protein